MQDAVGVLLVRHPIVEPIAVDCVYRLHVLLAELSAA